jgi:hypothetical protein
MVNGTLADLFDERAGQLQELARQLRTHQPGDVLGPHRLLQTAGTLLSLLQDVEREAHALGRFLPPPRAGQES